MQRFGKKLWVFLLHGRLSRQVGHHEDFELLGVLEGCCFLRERSTVGKPRLFCRSFALRPGLSWRG